MDNINICGVMIKKERLFDVVDMIKDFAFSKGMYMEKSYDERVIVPFCLLPSTFPKEWFCLVKSIQQDLNYVLHKISYSPEFLKSCFSGILETDEFIFNIFQIYETVLKEGKFQMSLGLFRSDYMLSTDPSGEINGIKQIENNVIATSFSGLSTFTYQLHKFVLERLGLKDLQQKLPENDANISMAKGLTYAWELYGNERAAIMFVVEERTLNIGDQRATEFAIYDIKSDIQVFRYTFSELRKNALLKDDKLIVDGVEFAVVYYRTGYVPAQYKPEDWDVRLLIERSQAIKCPSVGYHLAGTKTVQLHLLLPGVLEQFLPENSDPEKLRRVFVNQYSLKKGPKGDEAVTLAVANPQHYILKPEREGGGNNVHGNEIKKLLESIGSSDERQAYILMEKIISPKVHNCIVRDSCCSNISDILCELGIYGVIIGTKDEIHHNYESGHIIRSKHFESDEGGIVAGFGALDSPLLI